ncbi:sugar phosphate isomerase/epimerase family protein [Rubinisphaera brasiliensis]|uniref:Xylose isomerase domain-containing protein TIM barrel n=1 Tax=Rubinisphaera brasiliensis (strain ATCC 49424 / DSM 5305 / JCM 21570 / IAM 15109 / NBRC 103401 / IFAM 1448) TaxID=756272 RepID=F0STN1_RUBBR|nr:sugar phosphate isomerase/epimerase family protein [Rubinisphaera brasiliensis]ADY61500.1 Xylose isomerase domain-containing protein TIM barrel [Rubinisphaera brasiliensis DSM 5305]
MIKSAITVSLVEEARGGPFVFWDGLEAAFARSAELGFDAVEIFAPGPDAVNRDELNGLVEKHGLNVAAVGTGAGMVKHKLSLTDPSGGQREKARQFVKDMIDFGGPFKAPAIIGSMQGRWGGDMSRDQALGLLAEALNELGEYAAKYDVPLIYEPLNRYETNLITTIADGVSYMKSLSTKNVKLLADLFHMNIEEQDVAAALREGAGYIGHVHFVDSNRRATGLGHTDFAPIAAALKETGYDGYASAEAVPLPDSDTAAVKTIEAFKKYFRA